MRGERDRERHGISAAQGLIRVLDAADRQKSLPSSRSLMAIRAGARTEPVVWKGRIRPKASNPVAGDVSPTDVGAGW